MGYPLLLPENEFIWSIWTDILLFSGGGFDSDGGFDCGKLAAACQFVFGRLQLGGVQLDDLYEGLKIIIATARNVSAEKMKAKGQK